MMIVSPTEWLRRTAITLKKRSADTIKVDYAYQAWSVTPHSFPAAKRLYDELYAYVSLKGGDWRKVERDKVSGGLMAWVFEEVKKVPGVYKPALSPAQIALANMDIPHSRYGVLYLLGNIDIDMSMLAISLEGVSALGNAVGQGMSTNYGNLADAEAARAINVSGQTIKTGAISAGGAAAVKIGGSVAGGRVDPARNPREHHTRPVLPPPKRPEPGFPCTLAMWELVKEDPILMLNPFTLAGTVVGTTLAATVDALNSLRILLQNAVSDLVHYCIRKMSNLSADDFATLGATVKGLINFVVAKCLKSAAPFVGGALDLAGGMAKTIRAAKERVGVWLLRRKISLNPGHPELTANTIEHEMSKGVFEGLWTILKGVANTALTVFLPGAASLVAALVTGVEWIVKFSWRLAEQSRIGRFLTEARKLFLAERARATKDTSSTGAIKYQGSQGAPYFMLEDLTTYKPNMQKDPASLIHNLDKFKAFFQQGCDASPLIPMIVLNSGICGSLMVLLKMFDDLNREAGQEMYDAGNEYFTRLKQYSRNYMAKSGFVFKAKVSTEDRNGGYMQHGREHKFIAGLLAHSQRNHYAGSSTADKAVAFVAG